ncbi:MAG: hypothetical protein AB1689_03705 [Thermodesulfobacteriota bacterium]
MLPNIPDPAMTMQMSWDVPLGALLVVLLVALAALGAAVETGFFGSLGSRLGRRQALGRGRVVTAAPRG